MAKKTGQNGIDLIKTFEGFRSTAYKAVPSEKYWTIGYGHYGSDVKKGQTITKAEAEKLLKKDLEKFESYVNNILYVPFTSKLNQNQFDALVSFTYNLGPGAPGSTSGLYALCRVGFEKVPNEMQKFVRAGGKVLEGLVKRRKAEAKLFGVTGEQFKKRTNPKAKDLKKLGTYWSSPLNKFDTNPATGNNCTWYAWGRFQEIAGQNLSKSPGMINGHAFAWVDSAKKLGYKTSKDPSLGAIICWSYNGKPGGGDSRPGHVAVVEAITYDALGNATEIEISHGGYSSGDLPNEKLKRGDGKLGTKAWHRTYGNTYFNGFIHQPYRTFNAFGDVYIESPEGGILDYFVKDDRKWSTYFDEIFYNKESLEKSKKNAALAQERKDLLAGNTLKGMSLLAPSTFVESPFITAKIGDYTFGSYNKTGVLPNGIARSITFPNYMQSITVNKINGALNTYTLNMTYPITPNTDPNLLDRVFSSVSKSRKITLSYGDYMLPSFIYRNEEAIITKVTSRVDFANQKIDYVVQCTSTALALQGKKFNFPKRHCKGSTLIKELIKNTSYGIYDIFPGMKNINALNKIASDDKEIDIPAYKQIDILTYINYVVACMTAATNTGTTTLKDSVYQLIIMDDVDNNYGGTYFKVEKIGTTTRTVTSADVYEVDIGYPSNALVTNFSVNTDNSWAILYDYAENISTDHYNYSIDNQGNIKTDYVSSPMVSPLSNRMTEQSKTWWTQMTRFPITATLTIKGLLRSAMLMNYVRINSYFYGQKHISSGLYVITKQEDRIDSSGYRTTLSLTRIAGDDDASWNINQNSSLNNTSSNSSANKNTNSSNGMIGYVGGGFGGGGGGAWGTDPKPFGGGGGGAWGSDPKPFGGGGGGAWGNSSGGGAW